jgi:hypothetical protein
MFPLAVRVWRWRPLDAQVYVGPWSIRFATGPGRFGNGSRWRSGWHRWREELP